MTNPAQIAFGWVWNLRLPDLDPILRGVSWFFITLALIPIVPIIALVIYDLSLWFWRLLGARNNTAPQPGEKLPVQGVQAVSTATEPPNDDPSSSWIDVPEDGGLRRLARSG